MKIEKINIGKSHTTIESESDGKYTISKEDLKIDIRQRHSDYLMSCFKANQHKYR